MMHGSMPMSMWGQSQAPMVGIRRQMVASLDFEHAAQGWQSAGHCPSTEKTPQ
jgi:hypothetical protein